MEQEGLLLGIDIGTSACKAAVFEPDGRVAAQASEPYPVYHPQPGWAEQAPEDWWQAVCRALAALAQKGVSLKAIRGIGVDGQSWSAIPIGAGGRCFAVRRSGRIPARRIAAAPWRRAAARRACLR